MLGLIRSLLVEPQEGRLRSGWRLLLHLLLLAILTTLAALPLFGLAGSDPALNFLGEGAVASLIGTTLSVYIARRWLDRRSFRSLGLRWDAAARRDLLAGILIPLPLFGLIYLAEWGLGWLHFDSFAWQTQGASFLIPLAFWALLFVLVGWYEELLSRGYWLQNLAEGLSLPWAVFIPSAVFALAHAANPGASWASTLGILAAGYFLAYGYLRTRQLWLPIGLHIGWNFFEGPVFGFEVSGRTLPALLRHEVRGPELVTGGAFGPEAGLIVLPALALGAYLVYLYTGRYSTPMQAAE